MDSQQKSPKNKSKLQKGVEFSGVAFEMAATIGICVLLGKFLDTKIDSDKPILTALLSVLGVSGAIYNLIRKVTKNK